MKIPYLLKCKRCGVKQEIVRQLKNDTVNFTCLSCGHEQVITNVGTRGDKILHGRARTEFVKGDYDMAILFAAMAVESDLFDLYCRWSGSLPEKMEEITPAQLLEVFHRYGIDERVGNTSRVKYPNGLHGLLEEEEYKDMIFDACDILRHGGVMATIQEILFTPRNIMAHTGRGSFGAVTARRAYNIAGLLLNVMQEMDYGRAKFGEQLGINVEI